MNMKNSSHRYLSRSLAVAGIAFLSSSIPVFAAPSISGVSGTLTHGSSVTVSGSGFGSKTTAAPIKWDDFESGTLGESMVTRGWSQYSGPTPVTSAEQSHAGSRSSLASLSAGTEDFDGAYLPLSSLTTLYASMWFYWDRNPPGTPTGGEIFKWIRINASNAPGNEVYTGNPQFRTQMQPAGNWCYDELHPNDTLNGSGFVQRDCDPAPTRGAWTRMDVLYRLSNPSGTANGEIRTWYNGSAEMALSGVVTRASGITDSLTSILLPQMASLAGSASSYKFFIDDVYIDSTPARIEICNASTYAGSTHCEVQSATAWSAGSVTLTLNRGSFGTSDSAYLYVFDSANDSNSSGYSIIFGSSGGDITPPAPPTGLGVE